MTDTLKLKAKIMEKGMNIQSLSKEMQLSANALSNKINNKKDFKVSEIWAIKDLFQLSNNDIISIFFAEKVD